jgi:predicted type IV restriction endonuclease
MNPEVLFDRQTCHIATRATSRVPTVDRRGLSATSASAILPRQSTNYSVDHGQDLAVGVDGRFESPDRVARVVVTCPPVRQPQETSPVTDLRTAITDLAKRSANIAKACNNDESVKLYLVLPMLRALGYDSTDPLEVYPNHETDPIAGEDGSQVYKADFAILRDGQPVIAIGAARTSADLAAKRSTLATYYNAWPSVKVAMLSNGQLFEFYVDSQVPGVMDGDPFLTLDLETLGEVGPSADAVDTLQHATKADLDPDRIAERAHLGLVKKRLRTAFVEEAQSPSEDLARAMMARVGFPGVRREAIERHYAGLVKAAFEESLVLPVVQKLKAGGMLDGVASGLKLDVNQTLSSAEREIALFNQLRRRLAFLVEDETQYQALDQLICINSIGRIIVALDRDPDGRIVEIVRGSGMTDRYIFPDNEFVTSTMSDIDAPLKAAFLSRLDALEAAALSKGRKAG